MNARKYAWQILHAEIRRRCGADEGHDFHPQLENQGLLVRDAREEGVSECAIIFELAGFGATFAQMNTQNDPLTVAKLIEESVLAEPDDKDEDDGDD